MDGESFITKVTPSSRMYVCLLSRVALSLYTSQHARHEVLGRARKDAVDAHTQRGIARGTECVTGMTRQCRKPDPRGVLHKTSACECNKPRNPFILPVTHADAYVLNYESPLPRLFVLLVPLSLLGLLTDNQPARYGKRASQELQANQHPAELLFLLAAGSAALSSPSHWHWGGGKGGE